MSVVLACAACASSPGATVQPSGQGPPLAEPACGASGTPCEPPVAERSVANPCCSTCPSRADARPGSEVSNIQCPNPTAPTSLVEQYPYRSTANAAPHETHTDVATNASTCEDETSDKPTRSHVRYCLIIKLHAFFFCRASATTGESLHRRNGRSSSQRTGSRGSYPAMYELLRL